VALALSDQVVVLERGVIAHAGSSREFAADAALLDRLLGVARQAPREAQACNPTT
jgi:branched-chain amino acid transport system ATP-binding protein